MGRVRLVALLALLLLPACEIVRVQVGTEVPAIDGLEVGVTTREQALARMGPPHIANIATYAACEANVKCEHGKHRHKG